MFKIYGNQEKKNTNPQEKKSLQKKSLRIIMLCNMQTPQNKKKEW